MGFNTFWGLNIPKKTHFTPQKSVETHFTLVETQTRETKNRSVETHFRGVETHFWC